MDDSPPPLLTLYSPRQVYLAAFFGGPMAGAWYSAKNENAMSNEPRGRRVLLLSGLATVFFVPLMMFLPDKFPNLVIPLSYSWGYYHYAKTSLARGGGLNSVTMRGWGPWLKLLGISLCWLVATVAVWLAIAFLMEWLFPNLFPE